MRTFRFAKWDMLVAVLAVPLYLLGTHFASLTRVPPYRALDGLAYAMLIIAGAALGLRSTHPGLVYAVTLACCAIVLGRHHAYGPIFLSVCLALSTIVTRYGLRPGLAAVGLTGTVLLVSDIVGGTGRSGDDMLIWLAWYTLALLPFGVGAVIRVERDRRAAEAKADDERHLLRAQEERLAIAREIHDVLGHSLSVISMRAGVALHVADRTPAEAIDALQAIRRISKQSLDELRGALDIIRERRPTPGEEDIHRLVASLRAAGQEVTLVTTGNSSGISATTEHAVYRIVQESLTNVVRHAGHARAQVRVGYSAEEVTVSVVDDGGGGTVRKVGYGITGMRERARAVHGTLALGPRAGGGFEVTARLPARAERKTARDDDPIDLARQDSAEMGGHDPGADR
ncbi:sensor histidine kinase [Streptosporangium sp. KLBMP 9127]|nr:sensor histidine kinase [Streptosporangium sp. KLBMP 9127]